MPKILAIDDKQDNLTSITALLRNLMPECAVITAQSGPEGIDKAVAEIPDTVLLDVHMPGMDGFETCRRLKADARTRSIPVVMITAVRTDAQSRIKGLEIGADAFVSKPIDEHELVSQIKVAFRIREAEAALRVEREALEAKVLKRTAELRRNQLRYQALVEATSDWVWSINAENRYTYASPRVEDLLGYSPDEILGKTPFDLMPPQEAENINSIFQEICTARRPFRDLENLNTRKNGEPVYLETSGVPFFDEEGNFAGYHGIDRDITERKQAEKKITDQLDELQRWNDVMQGREERMIELKKEVNELLARAGQPLRYPSALGDG